MKKYLFIAIAIFGACMLITVVMQDRQIAQLTAERDKYKENTQTLLQQTDTYQIRDSLNAAKVGTLELTIKELEQFRAQDAALVRDLKAKNRDLDELNKAQMRTIQELSCVPHDTVIRIDSIPITAKAVHCGDEWYTFDGLMTDDRFTGTMTSRDELVLTETVRYKKFLFWKTRKILDREMEAVSKGDPIKQRNCNAHFKVVDALRSALSEGSFADVLFVESTVDGAQLASWLVKP